LRAIAHVVANRLDVRAELRVGEALGKQVQALEDRQPGANQRDELLVEDQEFFEIELLLFSADGDRYSRYLPPGLYRVNQEALLGVACAQLILSGRFGDLLVDLTPRVGVFYGKLGHSYCPVSGVTMVAPTGIWNLKMASSTAGLSFSLAKSKVRIDWSWLVTTRLVIV